MIDSLTWGGAEMLLADLALGAPSAGIDLSVGYLQEVDGSPAAARLRAAGVEPLLIGTGRLLEPRSLHTVRRHLSALAPDVLHTHLPTADALGAIAARTLGIPAVSTIHLIDRAVTDPPGARTALKSQLTALARRYGDRHVIAVSDAARQAYLRRFRERPWRVVTVHNGIAARKPTRSRGELRQELGIAPDAVVGAIVAVLREGKGHDLALEAIARLHPQHPNLVLLVVGDGPARRHVAELAAPLGTAAILTGHRDDVPDLLAASDVLLHPTRMDAFPTILLEACAAGVPMLATAVGGIPEIVTDGGNGLLLPPPPTAAAIATGLQRLLGDVALRRQLGAMARLRYEREFSAARWAIRLRTVYDVLVGG